MRYSKLTRENQGYLLITPFYLFLFVFILVPIVVNIVLSFTDYNLSTASFVGLNNYKTLLKDSIFLISIKNTLVYTFSTLFFTMVIALLIAVALNRNLVGKNIYRTCFFMPHVASMIAVSMIWLWLYDPARGIFNIVLDFVGIKKQMFLFDPNLAMPCIIFMSIWKWVGFNMIIFLAGLQGIPDYLYEAATIDGAKNRQKFFKITIPMLRPIIFFLFVTGTINNFRVFEQVIVLTQGGPLNATTTIVHQIYRRAFTNLFMGYAASQSVILLIITSLIIFLNFRFGKTGEDVSL